MTAPQDQPLDPETMQAIAARDQFWANLRVLLPELRRLVETGFGDSPRERQIALLLARTVVAELEFRGLDAPDTAGPLPDA